MGFYFVGCKLQPLGDLQPEINFVLGVLLLRIAVFCAMERLSLMLIFFLAVHMHFGCGEIVKAKCGYTFPSTDLASELQWGVLHCKGDSMRKILYKLGLAASVYYIWRERNSRIFKGRPTEPGALIQMIVEDIKASVCSWRKVPCSIENQRIGLDWGIPHWVFQ